MQENYLKTQRAQDKKHLQHRDRFQKVLEPAESNTKFCSFQKTHIAQGGEDYTKPQILEGRDPLGA